MHHPLRDDRGLRGRRRVAVAVLCATVVSVLVACDRGASAKYRGQFRSTGTIAVASPTEIPEPGKPAPPARPDEIALLQKAHCDAILSVDAIYADALLVPATSAKFRETPWYKSFASDAERKRNLRENLEATPVANSRLIQVDFFCADRLDAQIVLRELINPYLAREQAKQGAVERKQIELLKSEMAKLEFDLDQVVRPQRVDMEKGLGQGGMEISGDWNATRFRYDRLLQARTQVRAELAGLNIQLEDLGRDGKVPPELRAMFARDDRYLQARRQLDDLDIEIAQLEFAHVEDPEVIVRARNRRAKYQDKLDEIREELRSDYADAMRFVLAGGIVSASINSRLIETELFELNNQLAERGAPNQRYRMLQEKERRMQDKIDGYEQEIRRVAEHRLKLAWKPVQWQTEPSLPAARVGDD